MIDHIEKYLTIIRRCDRLTAFHRCPVLCLVVLWDGQPCPAAPSVLRLNHYYEGDALWKQRAR
jgi:hypothetical protein